MTTEEFSNEFDIAVNAYLPDGELFDEYEKSVALTNASRIYVQQLYPSFETKEIVREVLSPLIRSYVANEEYDGTVDGVQVTDLYQISDYSYFYKLPDDLWVITFEEVVVSSDDKCINNKRITVTPTSQDKLSKVLKNPFKCPNNSRALRLNIADNIVELISKYEVKRYFIRYIKKLKPIILTKLTDSTSIDGITERTECELHQSIHKDILNLAVQLALQTRNNKATQQVQQVQPNNQ